MGYDTYCYKCGGFIGSFSVLRPNPVHYKCPPQEDKEPHNDMPNLDSTMDHVLPENTGSGGSSPSNKYDSTMSLPLGSIPSASSGGNQRHANVQNSGLNKSASNGAISPKFYEDVQGNPGTLDSTMNSVLEISFDR